MIEKAKELVAKMTLEEKAALCSGEDFWKLKSVKRLGLDPIMMADGPHGLRKQMGEQDNMGVGHSVPAVCYPTASALACSFDRELAYEVGEALGEECLQEKVAVLLSPGANQKRSPLCGRNFEYFSEDPIISGEMAASIIDGIQSQGVGASLKHFAVNNQEKRRMTVNAVLDERTLRETYLKAFEIAVKKSKPWTVMCAYNKLNGKYCSENAYLLNDILREEWGFDGLVVSDWGAVNDRARGVAAGLDLEMPGYRGINDAKILRAIKSNALSEEALDKAATRVTSLILKGMAKEKKGYSYDVEAHHGLAVRASEESAVLLKNQDKILPGNIMQKAALIGDFAKTPRYQGAGSSKIVPIKVDNAYDAFKELGLELTYAPGYLLDSKGLKDKDKARKEAELIKEACDAARDKDVVYLFAGLPEGYESEGFDRSNLSLPQSHNKLIEAVAKSNPNLVVILIGGAPMELPWIDKVKGLLLTYLGGEGCGKATVNLLLGRAIPCGKLAETWPIKLWDTPSYKYFPGDRSTVEYRESIFVGYRYYEAAKKPVLFPFGYGLSYSTFTYSNLEIEQEDYEYGDIIKLTFQITNHGQVAAKETAFIFVSHVNEKVFLPKKELKGFTKLLLEPGETKTVNLSLDTKDFGYYNILIKDWYAESGDYTILVGSSVDNISLSKVIKLNSIEKPQPNYKKIAPSYFDLSDQEFHVTDREFAALYGKELPDGTSKARRPYHAGNTLEDVKHTLIGKIIICVANKLSRDITQSSKEEEGMVAVSMREMPFHAMLTMGGGIISEIMLEGILDILNGHYLKGIIKLIKNRSMEYK